ncbi:MAG: hypothetical protein DMD33_12715 [Gemmatimonadetes bacterium]|nr:MAG: hypothetical protein DMD33_12715 [Gemmatimonadota bacterium]
MDHSPIVVPSGADGLELLRIVPREENELSGRPQSNATHPVCPEREDVMQLGEAQQFAGALIRMSQIVVESDFDGLGVDTEVERRAHLRMPGWLTDRA